MNVETFDLSDYYFEGRLADMDHTYSSTDSLCDDSGEHVNSVVQSLHQQRFHYASAMMGVVLTGGNKYVGLDPKSVAIKMTEEISLEDGPSDTMGNWHHRLSNF